VCYLYILKSLKDNKLYVGVTKNLQKRFKQHNLGFVRSTKIRSLLFLFIQKNFLHYQKLEKKNGNLNVHRGVVN
jgi:predicted GIY-YIG superfamily endonuclease